MWLLDYNVHWTFSPSNSLVMSSALSLFQRVAGFGLESIPAVSGRRQGTPWTSYHHRKVLRSNMGFSILLKDLHLSSEEPSHPCVPCCSWLLECCPVLLDQLPQIRPAFCDTAKILLTVPSTSFKSSPQCPPGRLLDPRTACIAAPPSLWQPWTPH